MALDVHAHRTGLDGGRCGRLGVAPPAQHGADAGDQLARGERLGDVVVGADLEPDHLVDLAVLGGQHDDRHLRLGPHRAADLGAGQAGQHQVEQDQVGTGAVELGERLGPGAGDATSKPSRRSM